jgi:hypothetical protein
METFLERVEVTELLDPFFKLVSDEAAEESERVLDVRRGGTFILRGCRVATSGIEAGAELVNDLSMVQDGAR